MMHSSLSCGLLVGFATLSSCNSTGNSAPAFHSGTQSVGVAFALEESDLSGAFGEGAIETLDLTGNWGYFVSPNVEFGTSVGYSSEQQSLNGSTFLDAELTTLGINTRYYFASEGLARPYVGFGLGFLSGSSDGIDIDGNYYGIAAGLATFLSESVALDARFSKAWSSEDWSDGVGIADVDRDMFAFLVGLSFYF